MNKLLAAKNLAQLQTRQGAIEARQTTNNVRGVKPMPATTLPASISIRTFGTIFKCGHPSWYRPPGDVGARSDIWYNGASNG